jgi:DNA-binding transcriptional ArsR family regulator
MDEVLRAIAEPRRREILWLVRTREMAAGEIAAHFSVTRPAISQHLRVLREAGLIVERRDGTFRYYRVSQDGLVELRASLAWLWDDGLARLKALAEAEEGERNDGDGCAG